jgi:ESCRT-II complex subunit VPS36
MFLKNIDLTTALRPSFLPDEVLRFVQDNVGLYEGYVAIPLCRDAPSEEILTI